MSNNKTLPLVPFKDMPYKRIDLKAVEIYTCKLHK